MTPTIPESDFEAMDDTNFETTRIKKYVYDVKFEVVMKEATKMIPGKASLTKAMTAIKNAKRKDEKIDFLDTNGTQISHDLRGIDQDDIEGRFCMEVGGADGNHLFFACTIQTTITFSVLKNRTIDEFKKNNIYFKIHKGGFKYGVNWSPIGFFLKQHPGFIDNHNARDNMMKKISKSWHDDNEFFDDDQKNKIIRIIEPDENIESFNPMHIPFEIVQTSVYAKNTDNESIRTNAVVVTIPYQFFKVGIAIMDHMAITNELITNYVPLGYKKEEPESFFNIVYDHSVWIENVRHATITNIPTVQHFETKTNSSGETLASIPHRIPNIDNISFISSQRQVHIAIPSTKLQHTTDKIKDALTTAEFDYKPQVAKRFNPTGSLGSNKSGTSKYSKAMSKYQTARSPNASVATSYGEEASRMTGYTGRSWGTQRKIPKEIDFTDATEFPPLQAPPPTTDNTTHQRTVQSTMNDESITDTTVIQQAIDSALKKAYEDHRRELEAMQKRFDTQLEELKQQQNTTSLELKFDKLFEMLTSESQITRESPIRKKGRPNNLEATTYSQTDTPMRSNRTQIETNNDDMETDDDEPLMGPLFTKLPDSPPRNNERDTTLQQSETDTITARPEDEGWLTKGKKGKKSTKMMTQTTILDTMSNGGYGNQTNSPPRRLPPSPTRNNKGSTPTRPGRGTPPRPIQAEKANGNKIVLTSLTSSRSGQKTPHGRET